MLAVRRLAAGDLPAITAIVRSLPDYFTDEAAGQVQRDCADHGGWVLADAGEITGFAVAARKSPGGAEILRMAVDPAQRGRRTGTALRDHVLGDLAAAGVIVVEVKTLDRSADFPPTRPPGPSGNAGASSRSTRCPDGSQAVQTHLIASAIAPAPSSTQGRWR